MKNGKHYKVDYGRSWQTITKLSMQGQPISAERERGWGVRGGERCSVASTSLL